MTSVSRFINLVLFLGIWVLFATAFITGFRQGSSHLLFYGGFAVALLGAMAINCSLFDRTVRQFGFGFAMIGAAAIFVGISYLPV